MSVNLLIPMPPCSIVGGGTTAPRAGVTIPTGGTLEGIVSALLKPNTVGSGIGAWKINIFQNVKNLGLHKHSMIQPQHVDMWKVIKWTFG